MCVCVCGACVRVSYTRALEQLIIIINKALTAKFPIESDWRKKIFTEALSDFVFWKKKKMFSTHFSIDTYSKHPQGI